MKSASSRPPECDLQLVEANMMELSPMGTKWDMLGIVAVGANHGIDPTSQEARALIRPKACALGGTAVALMQTTMSATTSSTLSTTSGTISFAVLRPKQAAREPTKF